ncbi:hypothetical protein EXIGLDRAFT_834040 [Exidia glandulosa HHB12029]|uniref:ELYS-like domain-containing protein n=1 Tax=Exidia glandulosa HHB12029 TaxID=1314781 RepID=A0A165K6S6_EXIGL|nr:hypothetical protein EXIGLDRAFT_834040 [Exidia glandulosa HHB12029]
MEVDELNDDYLLPWFELDDDAFPWREDVAAAVHARRAAMGGQLFIDILLPAAADSRVIALADNSDDSTDEGTSAGPLFPPSDAQMFRKLLVALQRSSLTSVKRDSIALYFLWAWYPNAAADPNGFTTGPDGEPYANALDDAKLRKFAQARLIAPQYAALARAYYLLDSGVLEPAVAILSDARILPEWSSKILHTLSLPGLDISAPLVLKYVRCAKPTISDMVDVQTYLAALVKSSFMDAWMYQRSFPAGPFREQCIRHILDLCLIPEHQAAPLKLLVAFPFDAAEDATVSAYAQQPQDSLPPKSLAVLRQLLLVRLIQSGRYTDALKFDRANPVPDHDEARVKERRALMRHVIGLVPRAVREDVEREYASSAGINGKSGDTEPNSPKRVPSASGSWAHVGSNPDMAASLSMSWEDLGKSTPNVATNGSARRPSYSRLEGPAAPAFGTPTKRNNTTDSPGRGRAYDIASRTPTLVASSQPSTLTPGFKTRNQGLPENLRRGVPPIYNPSPSAAFSPARPAGLYQPSPATAFSPAKFASTSNGTVTPSKRPLPESPLIPPVLRNEDIEMVESDDPDAFVVRPQRSVFMNGNGSRPPAPREQDTTMDDVTSALTTRGTLARQESQPSIPGAFPSEEKRNVSGHRSKRQRQAEAFEPIPEEPKAVTTRVTRRGRRMSIPGEMPDMRDGDSTTDEEEDAVPALPRPAPTRGKKAPTSSRKSRASSSEAEGGVVRRSSRLSGVADLPPPPVQVKKKTSGGTRKRASVNAAAEPTAGTSRMATRRSRMTLDGVEE